MKTKKSNDIKYHNHKDKNWKKSNEDFDVCKKFNHNHTAIPNGAWTYRDKFCYNEGIKKALDLIIEHKDCKFYHSVDIGNDFYVDKSCLVIVEELLEKELK